MYWTWCGGLKTECTGKPTEMENPSANNNIFSLQLEAITSNVNSN